MQKSNIIFIADNKKPMRAFSSEEIKKRIFRRFRSYRAVRAEHWMKKNASEAWDVVTAYHNRLGAGALRKNWTKYEFLFRFIKARKPTEILELGTGISTVVIAHALMENKRESTQSTSQLRVTSMEESPKYHARTIGAFPENLKKYAEILVSPKVEDYYQLFRGVKYKDVPVRPYEMVFVDGPTTGAPSDGHKTFDFDFLNVVSRSESPVYCVVDLRLSSMWVYEHVFGRNKARLGAGGTLGFVGPVTKHDMRVTGDIITAHSFRGSFL